jgi:BMFP domain-containing protein YqiC
MSELKKCPFCGRQPYESGGYVSCHTELCLANADYHEPAIGSITDWNTRPIEDALNARIAELEAEKCVLIDQQREAKNILIDKNLHIDSLYEEGYKLQQRIAELEGKIDQLTAHGDIERQDDKSSNDTQTQTIVYGKEDSEVQE